MYDDIKRRVMIEPSTKTQKNPKFKVGDIVYRVKGRDTEEFLVVAVGVNIEKLMRWERVEFWYTIINKPTEESPAMHELRELQGTSYALPYEIKVKEEDLISDAGEFIRVRIQEYENQQEEIKRKIHELKVKLEERTQSEV